MEANIDETDKKIMFELDKNSRQSIVNISKNTQIQRNIVEYRIKKLTKNKVITKFVTEIALGKLGYSVYKIYCQISGLSKETQEQFYKDLFKNPNFSWVAKCEGRWDLLLATYAKNIIEFNKIKKEFLLKYGKYLADYSINIIGEAYILERTHLIKNKKLRGSPKLYIGGDHITKLEKEEKNLLKLLANNCRIKIIDLVKKSKLNAKTIINKINKLKKIGIIQGYTTFFDLNKINYQFYKICIYLKGTTKKEYEQLIDYCKNHPNIIHIIESIGPWELELEIEAPSNKEFQELSNTLRNKFSNAIKKVESVIISKEIKLEFLPVNF